MNGYCLAARTCAADVSTWLKAQKWNTAPEFIFEIGDEGVGMVTRRFMDDGYAPPVFRYGKGTTTAAGLVPAFLPLQAADMLAYEIFKKVRDSDEGIDRQRWTWDELDKIPGIPGIYSASTVEQLQEMLNLSGNLNAWVQRLEREKRDTGEHA